MHRSASRLAPFIVLCVAIALCASPVFAGRLIGEVIDEAGEPIEGVHITATSNEYSEFKDSAKSDERGRFMINFQKTQFKYVLLFEKPGYQSFQQELQPKSGTMREEFPMEASAAQVQEARGDLAADVIGSSNEAIEAFNAGLAAQKDGEVATAREQYQAAIEADPSLAPAHVGLAQVLLDQREHEAAAAAAQVALDLEAANREALRVRYEALRALGRNEEADAVGEALESAEGSAELARRVYNEGGAAFQAEDMETARAKFEEAASLDPTLYDAQHAVASLRLAQGDVEEAIEAAKRALTLRPDAVATVRVLYDAYEAQGNLEELTKIAPRLAEVDPDFGAAKLVEQGTELFNAGQTEAALPLLEQALAIDPQQPKAHYMLGVMKLGLEQNDAAKQHFATFLEMSPDDPDAATAREMLTYIQ